MNFLAWRDGAMVTRPHRWSLTAPWGHDVVCDRCGVHAWAACAILTDCPVVTPADAFEALAWVLGQVWRHEAWALLRHGRHVEVTVGGRLFEYALRGGPGFDDSWRVYCWIDWSGPTVGPLLGFDDARAAALDLIESLGTAEDRRG